MNNQTIAQAAKAAEQARFSAPTSKQIGLLVGLVTAAGVSQKDFLQAAGFRTAPLGARDASDQIQKFIDQGMEPVFEKNEAQKEADKTMLSSKSQRLFVKSLLKRAGHVALDYIEENYGHRGYTELTAVHAAEIIAKFK